MKVNIVSKICICLIMIAFASCGSKKFVRNETDAHHPKREFRGAWIHTVGQSHYAKMNSQQMQTYFVQMLDQLQAMGINAVIFQVRPQADAFYKSNLEPWSHYLTGVQGKAPDANFDPLAFLVSECHKRCMELHAWLNPYRVTIGDRQTLAQTHLFHREPHRFVKYGTQTYFDPALPENRAYICEVVKDIVLNYNVDAIHMDDYFYPYPIAGKSFPDDASFAHYAPKQGFLPSQRADWRRNNVNMLIKDIKQTLTKTKPWVRFGISPFGIYRNKQSTPDGSGSDTRGLQNYDDLYADVKLWVQKGWIDYNVPQIYWNIGFSVADHAKLVKWWSDNNFGGHLYIGQDVERTMGKTASDAGQLEQKMELSRVYPTIHGNVFWYGYLLMKNYKGIETELQSNYHRYPALLPAYVHMHGKNPKKVNNLQETFSATEHHLTWQADAEQTDPKKAQYFVVYRFAKDEKTNLRQAKNIVAITREKRLLLPYEGGNNTYKYVVTAVDAFHNESKGVELKVKL